MVFFDSHFTNWLRVTAINIAAGKTVLTCFPTTHSTATEPQLVVPVRYKALSDLQFWLFLAISAPSDVETSRAFLDFR